MKKQSRLKMTISTIILMANIMPAYGDSGVNKIPENRYGELRLSANPEQVDLLKSIVDIQVPGEISTVGDTIIYLLSAYGFQLEDAYSEQALLLTLPLPNPHRHLGPITLDDALDILGGESFQVFINPVKRTIQYQLKESYQHYISIEDIDTAIIKLNDHDFNNEQNEYLVEPLLPIELTQLYRSIQPGESLSSIVEVVGVNGMSFQQRMLQIFLANPHAFANNNINQLYTGVDLTIPNESEASFSYQEAIAVVLDHQIQWTVKRVGQ